MLGFVGLPITLANGVNPVKEVVQNKKGYVAKMACGKGVLEAVNYLIAAGLI
jgi:hypothetical protein